MCAQPRFGWQMEAPEGERGVAQAAYRIEVRDPKGTVVWDSTRVETPESLAHQVRRKRSEAATRYTWTVTVWDQAGARASASSWFETGLMDPSPGLAAWGGAKWIGGGNDDLVLYSPYLAVFDASYAVTIAPGSTRASFVYGANDSGSWTGTRTSTRSRTPGTELHQARTRYLGARRLARREGEAARVPRRLHGHRQPGAAAQDLRHRQRGDQRGEQARRAHHRVPQRVRPDQPDDRRQHVRGGGHGLRRRAPGAPPPVEAGGRGMSEREST